MHSILDDAATAGVVGAVITAVGFALGLSPLHWEAGFGRRLQLHQTLEELRRKRYDGQANRDLGERFESHGKALRGIYDFDRLLALRSSAPRNRTARLAERVELVDQLSASEIDFGYELAARWVALTGRFARAATVEQGLRPVPLRPFLQTYHLQLIREGALVEPFLVHRMTRGGVLEDDAVWGLALMDLARSYNSIARQQRDPVVFEVAHTQDVPAVVCAAPHRAFRRALTVIDFCSPGFRLYRWRYVWARRRVRRALASLRRG